MDLTGSEGPIVNEGCHKGGGAAVGSFNSTPVCGGGETYVGSGKLPMWGPAPRNKFPLLPPASPHTN